MMEEKYAVKKEDEPAAHADEPSNSAPERPVLKREETQEDLAFKKNMTLKYVKRGTKRGEQTDKV